MDYEKIKEAAQNYQDDMTRFLRAIVKNPGESCDERKHIETIEAEMKKLNFDEVTIDPQGNVIGYMGNGDKILAFDAHIDTVGIGNIENWNFDPYEGYETDEEIGGRGVSDQCGGLVSAVYGAKIMKDMNLIPEGYKIMVVGTVQEEDCDGLCWQYIINEDKIRPEFVVSTEPTDGGIYRGQRGRMEIRVDVKGVSCHGSAPERGDNAIYKMADILQDVRSLNENDDADETEIKGLVKMLNPKYNPDWEEARFLGRGTVTVSQIFYTSPSRCAVADSCSVSSFLILSSFCSVCAPVLPCFSSSGSSSDSFGFSFCPSRSSCSGFCSSFSVLFFSISSMISAKYFQIIRRIWLVARYLSMSSAAFPASSMTGISSFSVSISS